jgi:ubiquinone/menaquinone biosynthesis C-methylase UbiE
MSFYARRILPWLIERGMQNEVIARHRPRVPRLAAGRVLEIGLGTGSNLPHYGNRVQHLFGLEPSDYLRRSAAMIADSMPFPITLIGAGAEQIPLETASIDTVVSTWTMCSIPAIEMALNEVRRVLKPDGRLLFMEHGRSPDAEVAHLQDRLRPACCLLAGCNPNRPMAQLISEAGLRITDIEQTYLEGPRFLAFHYIGEARPA